MMWTQTASGLHTPRVLGARGIVAALAQRRRGGAAPISTSGGGDGSTPPPGGGGDPQVYTFTEDTTTDFPNPERGWYTENVYWGGSPGGDSFAGTPLDGFVTGNKPTLELYYVNLRNYRFGSLSSDFLTDHEAVFQAARSAGVKFALRYAYNRNMITDANGDPIDSECDTSLTQMQDHISDLATLWASYKDVIAVLQGGFAGWWGEQWGGAINTTTERDGLIDSLLTNTPSTTMVQWRDPFWLRDRYPTPITSGDRFGTGNQARAAHYNDCVGSGYDWQTYFTSDGSTGTQKLEYAEDIAPFVVMGGESCNGNGLGDFNNGSYMQGRFEALSWDYLNSEYWMDMYTKWDGEGYLASISRRLGYRLFLSQATLPTSAVASATVSVTLRFINRGFGKVYNPRPIDLILVGSGGPFTVSLTEDARQSLPLGGQVREDTWNVTMPAGLVAGATYALHLRMPDPSANLEGDDRYTIRLANSGMWDGATGRHDLGAAVSVPA